MENIKTVEQVRKYFEDNLLVVCQPDTSEEEKSSGTFISNCFWNSISK